VPVGSGHLLGDLARIYLDLPGHTTHAMQIQALRKQNQAEVLAQISASEEKRRLERAMVLEEGAKVVKKSDQYLAQVEAIKQKKLKELQEAGVPAKYCAELMKYEVGSSGK